ncbi:oligosaccharide flippase family protein [Alkaliflexus imshenetskii]|uniref:oligosaccharide flippase family protein n=1 Tax=Alkaliflexus imshenetskii TaxID=286730 RepID=UPI000479874F|nr:oligosaccharide flippase family protein [Alkaliflexus imshenetskii]
MQIKTIKELKKNRLVQNFSYLSLIQLFNLALPLVTYPYLIRVLGSHNYGWVVYVISIASFFSILINFGFNISGTQDVSVNRQDKQKVAEIFAAVLIVKFVLFTVGLLAGLTLVAVIPRFEGHATLLILALFTAISEVLLPVWFFQGIERMKYITLISLSSKLVYTILVFSFINQPHHYVRVPALMLLGTIVAGAVAFYIIFGRLKLSLILPSFNQVVDSFRKSVPFFLSRISAVAIQESSSILIGTFIGMKEVSYFDLARKVVQIVLIPYNILNQTLFPYIARTLDMLLVKKVIRFAFFGGIGAYVGIFFWGDFIIRLLGGEEMSHAKLVINILGLTIALNGTSFFLGNTVLVVKNHSRFFNQSIIFSFLVYAAMVSIIIIADLHSLHLYAYLVVLVGLFDVGYRYYFVKKLKLLNMKTGAGNNC